MIRECIAVAMSPREEEETYDRLLKAHYQYWGPPSGGPFIAGEFPRSRAHVVRAARCKDSQLTAPLRL